MQRKNISKTQQNGNILQEQTEFTQSDNSGGVRKASTGRGRIDLRAQPQETTFNLPKTLHKNKNKGPLSGGRGNSSRARLANATIPKSATNQASQKVTRIVITTPSTFGPASLQSICEIEPSSRRDSWRELFGWFILPALWICS